MSVADKLLQVNQVKQDIKTAIETKGIPMTNVAFTEYANKILDISGGGDLLASKQATKNSLGVNEVQVDSNGKLWSEAGSGGGGSGDLKIADQANYSVDDFPNEVASSFSGKLYSSTKPKINDYMFTYTDFATQSTYTQYVTYSFIGVDPALLTIDMSSAVSLLWEVQPMPSATAADLIGSILGKYTINYFELIWIINYMMVGFGLGQGLNPKLPYLEVNKGFLVESLSRLSLYANIIDNEVSTNFLLVNSNALDNIIISETWFDYQFIGSDNEPQVSLFSGRGSNLGFEHDANSVLATGSSTGIGAGIETLTNSYRGLKVEFSTYDTHALFTTLKNGTRIYGD